MESERLWEGSQASSLATPFYLMSEANLKDNMERMRMLQSKAEVRPLLALKCFSTWSAFPLMKESMWGTTSSSLNEVRLGYEEFGGETHAYSVAFPEHEIDDVLNYCDKIIFNSLTQLERFEHKSRGHVRGLRINPGKSHSNYPLADPACLNSRLGVSDRDALGRRMATLKKSEGTPISGFMVHNNCDNSDLESFASLLEETEGFLGDLLQEVEWLSLGGGILFTEPDYPFEEFCSLLKAFADRHQLQLYLEPGEAAVRGAGYLVCTVLDVITTPSTDAPDLVVVDASIEAHMPDLLVYRLEAQVEGPRTNEVILESESSLSPKGSADPSNAHPYKIYGRSCLAGDVFTHARFRSTLEVGDRLCFREAAGYTMVKKNWFNGLPMPTIALGRESGEIEIIRSFDYADYKQQLS